MTMHDMDESLPPKPWSAMDKGERDAAFTALSQVTRDTVQAMIANVNGELAERGCPLRLRGSLSIRWEHDYEPGRGAEHDHT